MDGQEDYPAASGYTRRGTPSITATPGIVLIVVLFWLLLTGSTACGTKDTIPPTPPTNLRYALLSSKDLRFSWDAATDNGSGLETYLCKTSWEGQMSKYWNYNGLATFYSASPPQDTGVHTFMVKAVDKAGNESDAAAVEFSWDAENFALMPLSQLATIRAQ